MLAGLEGGGLDIFEGSARVTKRSLTDRSVNKYVGFIERKA